MTYVFECQNASCGKHFDVIRSVREMDEPGVCSTCNNVAKRIFIPSRVLFSGAAVQNAEYNPGLGCITRNKSHRDEIARQKGLIEVGNEKPEILHKLADKARDEKWEKGWAETTKGWVGNGE